MTKFKIVKINSDLFEVQKHIALKMKYSCLAHDLNQFKPASI